MVEEEGKLEKRRGRRTYHFYIILKFMSSHTWACFICLIWIIWQEKLFGWSAQGFVEEWTELLSENGINSSEKFQYICKFQHAHFYHVSRNMYSSVQFSSLLTVIWGCPSNCSQIFDTNLHTHTHICISDTYTYIYIYKRCSFNLIWESISVAMQESVEPYHVQNISSFRLRYKVYHHNNQHVPPTKKKSTLQQQPSPT